MAKTRRKKSSGDVVEIAPPNQQGRWVRLLFTLVPIVVYLLARRISLPTVDRAQFALRDVGLDRTSIVALGIMPLISAVLLVELAAVSVPQWRHLRHSGEVGRAKLQWATNIVFLVVATFQSYANAIFFEGQLAMKSGLGPELFTTVTLVGGAILLKLAADFATQRGLVNGYGVLVGALCFADIAEDIWIRQNVLTSLELTLMFAKIVAIGALTYYVLEGPRAVKTEPAEEEPTDSARSEEPVDTDNPYAGPQTTKTEVHEAKNKIVPNPVILPSPASGITPYSTVWSVLSIPAALAAIPGMQKLASTLEHPVPRALVTLSLFFSLTFLFTWLFQQPRKVAEAYARADESRGARARYEAEAQNALRHATAYSLLYMLLLWVLDLAAKKFAPQLMSTGSLALTTAVIADFAGEWRMLAQRKDLVSVWPEHRPYALAIAKKTLQEAGIFVHIRDERQRRILQFTGAYVPMEICVPHADASRARAILEKVLPLEKLETQKKPGPIEFAVDSSVPRRPVNTALLVGLGVLALGALFLAFPTYKPPKANVSRTTKLEFVLAHDDESITDGATDPSLKEKFGLRYESEQVSIGPGKTAVNKYVVAEQNSGETLDDTRKRLEAWIKEIRLPRGTRVAFGEYQQFDENIGNFVTLGWRTYLIKDVAILTEADVASAQAMPDVNQNRQGWLVMLEFTTEGAQRFEQVTGENIKRRFAILLDGRVQSAPVIQSKIPGGRATITMGRADKEQQRIDAMNLEKALNGD